MRSSRYPNQGSHAPAGAAPRPQRVNFVKKLPDLFGAKNILRGAQPISALKGGLAFLADVSVSAASLLCKEIVRVTDKLVPTNLLQAEFLIRSSY